MIFTLFGMNNYIVGRITKGAAKAAAGMKTSRYRMPADAAQNTYVSVHTTVLQPSLPVPAITGGLSGAGDAMEQCGRTGQAEWRRLGVSAYNVIRPCLARMKNICADEPRQGNTPVF